MIIISALDFLVTDYLSLGKFFLGQSLNFQQKMLNQAKDCLPRQAQDADMFPYKRKQSLTSSPSASAA